jgi:cell division protein FtsL
MNAAARLLNQGELSRGWVVSVFLNRFHFSWVTLIFAVLVSALSLIYAANTVCYLNASVQQLAAERDRLHVQTGQLLLEKSTLMMQTRVQNIAEKELDMVVPAGQAVIVVNAK